MKYLTAVTLGVISFFTLVSFASVQAGDTSLEVASDSNFSSQTTNFSAGQTIYVRVNANNEGTDKHQLNLRDNQYNLIQSYNLNKEGSKFTASLSAPSSPGYYSLEAQITSAGANSTSVKTIKIGEAGNASVKVDVDQSSDQSKNKQEDEAGYLDKQSPQASPTSESSPVIEIYTEKSDEQDASLWTPVFNVVLKVADFFWPF